ncbi:MAG: serine/threonine-protein kinase [Blastocatellia bacterium]
MKPERWRQIESLYHAVFERAPDERAACLAEACAGDADLRREVESLLAVDESIGGFIDQPAFAVVAPGLAEEQGAMRIGQRIGHYQILSLLGKGGMGEVYLAQDVSRKRQVAIKLLPAQFTADAERVQRFEREARAASALNHPNILTIHEIGETDNCHYIVSEHVAGETLRALLKRGRLEINQAIGIAEQIASAPGVAHEAGIIHRDIKPETVMLRPDGLVKILDFGLAKLTGLRMEEAETLQQGVAGNPQSTIRTPRCPA